MIPEDKDLDPDNPDNVDYEFETDFSALDNRKWNSNNPMHVIEHDRAQEEFEARRQSRIFMNQNSTERLAFGVTKEIHVDMCTCSFCGNNGYDRGLKKGLNIPHCWWTGCWVYRKAGANNTSIYYRWWPRSFFRLPSWRTRNAL